MAGARGPPLRPRSPIPFCVGEFRIRGWTSSRRGERPRRRPWGRGSIAGLLRTADVADTMAQTAARQGVSGVLSPVNRLLHSYARARARAGGRPATSLLAELRGWGSSPTATRLATARTRPVDHFRYPYARARPAAAAATAVADSFFANSGPGWGAPAAAPVQRSVGGDGARYGDVAATMAQTAARQGPR
jgi:hypothetical protein